MKMTKRDIADISLVLISILFIINLVNSLLTIATIALLPGEDYSYGAFLDRTIGIPLHLLHFIVILSCIAILLFKRDLLVDRLFPDASDKELCFAENARFMIDYFFWIKLIGVYFVLVSAIHFISSLSYSMSVRPALGASASFFMRNTGVHLVRLILWLVVIWQAQHIATIFGKIGASNKALDPTSGNAPSASPEAGQD